MPCFFSLKHGERIGYSVYLCEQLRQLYPNQKVQLMYDIACSLERHLKGNNRSDILDHFEFAVPVFHAYGHESACQMKYNPRNILGFGLSDGEVVERVWSFLRRFSAMTKEMHPSHRIDVLSDALSYYCQKSAQSLYKLLPKRLVRARKVKQESSQQLQELMDKSPEPLSGQTVAQWADDEKAELGTSNSQRPEQEQEKLRSLARERWFLLRLKSKYAAGQAIAIRLSRRINVVTKQLKSKLETFNAKQPPTRRITWQEVTQLDADQPNTVPRSTKYQAVRLFHKAARADEEEFRIVSEMRNTIQHHFCKLEVITAAISQMGDSEVTRYQNGARALLLMKKNQCELDLARLNTFVSHGHFPELSEFLASLQSDTVTDWEEHQLDSSVPENFMPAEPSSISESCEQMHHSDSEEVCVESMVGDSSDADSSDCDDFYDCSDQEWDDCNDSPAIRAHQQPLEPPCELLTLPLSPEGQMCHRVHFKADCQRSEAGNTKCSDPRVTPMSDNTSSSSDGEEMEVQHWKKAKFLKEEYIRSTMNPIKLNDEQQQILSRISEVGSTCGPSTSGSFLTKSRKELQRMAEAANKTVARTKAVESLAKGPHFIQRKDL